MKILQILLIIGTLTFRGAISHEIVERIVTGRNCTDEETTRLGSIAATNVLKTSCGGSFVASEWMVTAAHCCEQFLKKGFNLYTVMAGQIKWLVDVEQISHIEKVFIPSDFTMSPVTNDVCLIKLKEAIKPSKRVQFSKLATTKEFEEMRQKGKCNQALVMGHGSQVQRMYDVPVKPILEVNVNPHAQCLNMQLVGRERCQNDDLIGHLLTESMLCMESDTGGICQGDSGGPIYCQDIQIGVASAAFGCADLRFVAAFARVDLHISYFEALMNFKERSGDNASLAPNVSVSVPATTAKVIKSSSGTYFIGYYKILLCILLYVML